MTVDSQERIDDRVPFEECQKFAKQLLKEYEESHAWMQPGLSFGEWVLKNYYPTISADSHQHLRDMCTTPRTADAYLYLLGILISGRLPIIDLERTENETHKHS